ncbi:hypothetical protein [Tatumella morbirosei]|uniref:hypothetical protein n=1 Tax=Tatumella morbirosei TaxID=642227 RepID=UPI000B2A4F46|nr:hypothetical protein [Tatumella morbirosei]
MVKTFNVMRYPQGGNSLASRASKPGKRCSMSERLNCAAWLLPRSTWRISPQ